MLFLILFFVICMLGLLLAGKMSVHTERFMRLIWEDPTDAMKVKVAKRVKELCIDGDVPDETAAMMIAKENGVMEEQVRDLMRCATADPVIMRMAFGSRIGGMVYKGLKKFGGGF